RSFRYDELATSGTDRSAELRTALGSASIHKLPSRNQESLKQSALTKTQAELSAADSAFVTGLTSGATSFLARDLGPLDQATLQRNVGATAVSKTFSGG